MGFILVRGRGLKEAVCKVVPAQNGVTLRIDDARNPETWIEVYITNEALKSIYEAQFDNFPWSGTAEYPE